VDNCRSPVTRSQTAWLQRATETCGTTHHSTVPVQKGRTADATPVRARYLAELLSFVTVFGVSAGAFGFAAGFAS
jgi:hypothetical protein